MKTNKCKIELMTECSLFILLLYIIMKAIIEKLVLCRQAIKNTETKKLGYNKFSDYNYFTPEQIHLLVQNVCEENGLFTKFDLKRNELGVFGVLSIYDVSTGEKMEWEMATAIPEIKATNAAQQLGGCMTYTERYLKMTVFGIVDNTLDPDTTENTEKTAKAKSSTATKSVSNSSSDLQRFNDSEYKILEANKTSYANADVALTAIKAKYKVSWAMEAKVKALYTK